MQSAYAFSLSMCVVVGVLTCAAAAQTTLDAPRSQWMPYKLQSGNLDNPQPQASTVFLGFVQVPEAAWLRLHFSEVTLGEGSIVRFTSPLDGEVQELDADDMVMWSHTSAYFNGDTVQVELIAGPNTVGNTIELHLVEFEATANIQISYCGLCGPDNRTLSSEDFAGRLVPGGCSAAVYNQCSCLVSAGHCASGSSTIQFNVPPSQADCNITQPPVADQFPITGVLFSNNGVGNDWAVFTTGTNNLGETIFQRYGEYRAVATAPPVVGNELEVFGYGLSKICVQSQTQTRGTGNVTSFSGTFFNHTADTTGGNSGSGVIHNNQILGIATHCPCPNTAQRIDFGPFAAARAELCDCGPPNDNCIQASLVFNGATPFSNVDATTDGFDEPANCNFNGYTNIGRDVWYKWVPTCNGTATISLCGADFNSKIAVYPGGCPASAGQSVACADNSCGDDPEVNFPVIANTLYRIRIGGFNGATGSGTMVISCTPNPSCPGDADDSGEVNVDDLLMVINSWGPCAGCPADFDGNNIVNVDDLLTVINNWGPC